ncbi:MAG: Gx transporter family protein [Ruminiclostridium sp.]
MKNTAGKVVLLAVLTGVSLGLFVIELLIPPFPFCPAAKIGLANVVTLFMLMHDRIFRVTDCFLVLFARCILSAVVTGRLTAILFSLVGGISALFAMVLFKKALNYEIIVSIGGALAHNMGQILVSFIFYGVFSIFYMLPAFLLSGILSGALTGALVMLIRRNKKFEVYIYNRVKNGKE